MRDMLNKSGNAPEQEAETYTLAYIFLRGSKLLTAHLIGD